MERLIRKELEQGQSLSPAGIVSDLLRSPAALFDGARCEWVGLAKETGEHLMNKHAAHISMGAAMYCPQLLPAASRRPPSEGGQERRGWLRAEHATICYCKLDYGGRGFVFSSSLSPQNMPSSLQEPQKSNEIPRPFHTRTPSRSTDQTRARSRVLLFPAVLGGWAGGQGPRLGDHKATPRGWEREKSTIAAAQPLFPVISPKRKPLVSKPSTPYEGP